jgi:hypothetical protein
MVMVTESRLHRGFGFRRGRAQRYHLSSLFQNYHSRDDSLHQPHLKDFKLIANLSYEVDWYTAEVTARAASDR